MTSAAKANFDTVLSQDEPIKAPNKAAMAVNRFESTVSKDVKFVKHFQDPIFGVLSISFKLLSYPGSMDSTLVPELCELNNHLMKAPSDKISISADYKRFEEELRVS